MKLKQAQLWKAGHEQGQICKSDIRTNACEQQQHVHCTSANRESWQFLCAVMWTAHVIMVIACRNWMQTAQLICFLKRGNLATLYTKESNNNYNMLFKPLRKNSVFPCSCAKIFSSCHCACTLIGRNFCETQGERWMNFICLTECCTVFLNEQYQQQLILLVEGVWVCSRALIKSINALENVVRSQWSQSSLRGRPQLRLGILPGMANWGLRALWDMWTPLKCKHKHD